MAQVKLVLGESTKVIIASKANAKFVYEDGKKTDKAVKSEKGLPLYSYTIMSEELGEARLVTSKADLAFGAQLSVPEGAIVNVRAEASNNFAKIIYTFNLG